ncbi:hypothetical protein [Roseivirga sp. E12]|uniref:hypothetical protein n=1 Tax=Roseivirga sp. E12 TaxID=2819237 RepID=UPI001ABD1B64|nr:hypothetical protein [Roseivirga sp. E12]MBO3697890.1 hypothetical protein [Roseivirga sp. E12]
MKRRKPVSSDLKISKPNQFDILNHSILGPFREVFNAWSQITSKVFTHARTVFRELTGSQKDKKQARLLLQLIPIDPKKEDVFVEIRRPEDYGNRPV